MVWMGADVSEHYSLEAWTDFARGLDPSGQRVSMQAHLDSGCASCRRRVQLLEATWAASRDEAFADPPAWAVERAKAIFQSAAPHTASKYVDLLGELFFDSWRMPTAFGLRSGEGGPRELRFRAEGLEVELHLEKPRGARVLQIEGQLSSPGGLRQIAGASVEAVAAGRPMRAGCNEFGEFQMELRAVSGVSLRILLPDRLESLVLNIPD